MLSIKVNILFYPFVHFSGICMNSGIIGELIASKECVAGEYSVCSAFLRLISNVSQVFYIILFFLINYCQIN